MFSYTTLEKSVPRAAGWICTAKQCNFFQKTEPGNRSLLTSWEQKGEMCSKITYALPTRTAGEEAWPAAGSQQPGFTVSYVLPIVNQNACSYSNPLFFFFFFFNDVEWAVFAFPLTSSNRLVQTRRMYFHFEGDSALALIQFFVLKPCNKTASLETMLKAQREKLSVGLLSASMFQRLNSSNWDCARAFFVLL